MKKRFSQLDNVLMSAVGKAFADISRDGSPEACEAIVAMMDEHIKKVYPDGFERFYPDPEDVDKTLC